MSDKQQNSVQSPTDAATLRKQDGEQARTSLSTQTPEEIQRMLHELRVHQIELETQNEELRTAQAQIETGRARYFDIYDQAPVGYCTLSGKGLILEANLTAATLLGMTRDAMVRQPVFRFILKEDQDIYYLHRKKLFETGEPQECELRLVKPEGTLFWAHLTAIASQAEDGAPLYRVVIIDITERKLAEKALAQKSKLLEYSQALANLGSWEWDIAHDTWCFSAQWKKIHGVSENNLDTSKLIEIAHPEDAPYIEKAFIDAKEQGKPYNIEHRIIKADNRETRYIKAIGEVEFDQDTGHPIRMMGTAQDITERRRNEEALRESEERFRLAMDAVNDGLWDWDVKTGRVYFSPGYWKILGYDPDGVSGVLHSWQSLIHPDDRERTLEVNQRCIDGQSSDFAVEYRMYTASGDWIWILGRGKAIHRDSQGRALRIVGTHVDITERKRHEHQLSSALSEKEVLLREVHHRVKNNLAAIISLMDMQRRNLEDPNGQIALTELRNRIRSMSLVHEKLYRADSLATIDFHGYIQALISHLRTTFGSPDITCRIEAPGVTIPLDLASPCGLIVNELVTNALKYAFPEGNPRLGNSDCRILVRLHRDNDTYTLTVADNGIGWPAGFDWTETRTLGMTLVRMLGQHQLGGRYVVDQGVGTSITLTFTDRKKEVPGHG